MYYVYRYMLDAVNDYDVLLKAKNAVIGILAVDIMEQLIMRPDVHLILQCALI